MERVGQKIIWQIRPISITIWLHISPDSILGSLIIIITIIIIIIIIIIILIIIIIIRVFKLNFSGPCDFYVTRRRRVKLILIQIKLTASVWNARGE